MPSTEPLLSLSGLVETYRGALPAQVDSSADTHAGSLLDVLGGTAAMLWSRQAQRDRDLFRAVYFDTAEGYDLTRRVALTDGIARELDTFGVGTATLTRASVAAGAGTVWTGTRLSVSGGTWRTYAVTSDVAVGASALTVVVPICATETGPGTGCVSNGADGRVLRLEDPLWDRWNVSALACEEGTAFEPAEHFRARVRTAREASRVGFSPAMREALQTAGCAQVALLQSDYGLDPNTEAFYTQDSGVSVCYVGDAGYTGSVALVRAASLALEQVRVCGAAIMVLPMASQAISVALAVRVWDASYSPSALETAIRASVLGEFMSRDSVFLFRTKSLEGAAFEVSEVIRSVSASITLQGTGTPVVDPELTASSWPAVLTRYSLGASDVTVTFTY
jgi:hypothetical protein